MASTTGFDPTGAMATGARRTRIKKVTGWTIPLVLVLAVVAWFAVRAVNASGAETDRYATTGVTRGSIDQTLSTSGTVEKVDQSSAAFPAAGTVTKVQVHVGDKVTAGQELAQMDDRELRAAVLEAKSTLADAKASLEQAEDAEDAAASASASPSSSTSASPSSSDSAGTSARPSTGQSTAPSSGSSKSGTGNSGTGNTGSTSEAAKAAAAKRAAAAAVAAAQKAVLTAQQTLTVLTAASTKALAAQQTTCAVVSGFPTAPTPTPSASTTETPPPTPSPSTTETPTPSRTPTPSTTPSSPAPSATDTPSASPTPSATTKSPTPSASASPSPTASTKPSTSVTPTESQSPTTSQTPTPSAAIKSPVSSGTQKARIIPISDPNVKPSDPESIDPQALADCVAALGATGTAQAEVSAQQTVLNLALQGLIKLSGSTGSQPGSPGGSNSGGSNTGGTKNGGSNNGGSNSGSNTGSSNAGSCNTGGSNTGSLGSSSTNGGSTASGGTSSSGQSASQGGTLTVGSAEAAVTKAQITLTSARAQLAAATMTSPINGVVSALPFAKGDAVNTTDQVVVIGKGSVQVVLQVPEAAFRTVKVGQAATVTQPGSGHSKGKVTALGLLPTDSTNSSATTYPVTVLASDKSASALSSGATATVVITLETRKNVITVPVSAVTREGTTGTVSVLDNGVAKRVNVTVGAIGNTTIEVTKGLSGGETLILADRTAALPTNSTNTRNRTGGIGTTTVGGGGPNFNGAPPVGQPGGR